jgi:hypothetical protein
MIKQALLDEVYLMNLLGHLKLANERGYSAGAEYVAANAHLQAQDPIEHLGRDLARELISGWVRGRKLTKQWPEAFGTLREALDQQFAPNFADLAPSQPRTTVAQVRALFQPPRVPELTHQLGLAADEPLFDEQSLRRILGRREWGIAQGGRSLVEVVPDIIQAAARRIGGDVDLLDWVQARLLSEKARAKLEQQPELLRNQLADSVGLAARRAEAEEVEFGYGTLTPLLSYAALDRRLVRIQAEMTKYGKDSLRECQQLCSGLREVVQLRVAAAMQLEGNYREAIDVLVGKQPAAEEGEEAEGEISAGVAARLLAHLAGQAAAEGQLSASGTQPAGGAERVPGRLGRPRARPLRLGSNRR